MPDPNRKSVREIEEAKTEIKQEKDDKPFIAVEVKKIMDEADAVESAPIMETKRIFNEKEKLNSPFAISQQGRRAIRHETLERDHDEH